MSRMKEALLELLDGLEYSLDENGSICFGNEESYREFFRRAGEMAKRYGKENLNEKHVPGRLAQRTQEGHWWQ